MFAKDFTDWLVTLPAFSDIEDGKLSEIISDPPDKQTDGDVSRDIAVTLNIPEGVPDMDFGGTSSREYLTIEVVISGYLHSLIREKTISLKNELHNRGGIVGGDGTKENPGTKILAAFLISHEYTRAAENEPEYSKSRYEMTIEIL